MVSRAIAVLESIAEGNNNNIEAPLFLAEIYRDGISGVKQNVSEAERYLRIAEDRGSADASIKLGDICLSEHNSFDARVHFEKVAERGSSIARGRLKDLNEFESVNSGINNNDDVSDVESCSYHGSKLPKNDEINKERLTKSFNGSLFRSVKQIQKEDKEQKKQKVISPTSGTNESSINNTKDGLGLVYEMLRDYKRASEYYKDAIKMGGSISAFYNLGRLYHNGLGVQKNYSKALKYYQLGAKRGDNKSKLAMLSIYLEKKEKNYTKEIKGCFDSVFNEPNAIAEVKNNLSFEELFDLGCKCMNNDNRNGTKEYSRMAIEFFELALIKDESKFKSKVGNLSSEDLGILGTECLDGFKKNGIQKYNRMARTLLKILRGSLANNNPKVKYSVTAISRELGRKEEKFVEEAKKFYNSLNLAETDTKNLSKKMIVYPVSPK